MISKLWVRFLATPGSLEGNPGDLLYADKAKTRIETEWVGSSSPLARAISVRFMHCSSACIERCLP